MSHIYDFTVNLNNNSELKLNSLKGKKILIVNTASKCGFTKQYDELEQLYQQNKSKLEIIAFPCNQFGGQEPGDDNKIAEFCSLNFNISFPISSKIEVNGKNAIPLFVFIKNALPGLLGTEKIKWNFTKFLFDEKGNPVKRFASNINPKQIEEYL